MHIVGTELVHDLIKSIGKGSKDPRTDKKLIKALRHRVGGVLLQSLYSELNDDLSDLMSKAIVGGKVTDYPTMNYIIDLKNTLYREFLNTKNLDYVLKNWKQEVSFRVQEYVLQALLKQEQVAPDFWYSLESEWKHLRLEQRIIVLEKFRLMGDHLKISDKLYVDFLSEIWIRAIDSLVQAARFDLLEKWWSHAEQREDKYQILENSQMADRVGFILENCPYKLKERISNWFAQREFNPAIHTILIGTWIQERPDLIVQCTSTHSGAVLVDFVYDRFLDYCIQNNLSYKNKVQTYLLQLLSRTEVTLGFNTVQDRMSDFYKQLNSKYNTHIYKTWFLGTEMYRDIEITKVWNDFFEKQLQEVNTHES